MLFLADRTSLVTQAKRAFTCHLPNATTVDLTKEKDIGRSKRDTYQIFDLEQGNPTFAYELDDAIRDGHLVPPMGIDVPFKFLRSGIKYSELLPDEQAEYEEKFADPETGEIPNEINAAALNRWLFNGDTIDQALEVLMERGIKVDGSDRLGKTIIFARRYEHAVEIEKRFNQNYPHYQGAFARIIDNYDKYAQSTLDDFCRIVAIVQPNGRDDF